MNTPHGSILLFRGLARLSWRATVAVVVAVAVAMGSTAHTLAQNVMIVVSGDAKPYKAAQSAIAKQLKSLGIASHTEMLSSLLGDDSADALSGVDSDVYVAVGTPATLWLYRRLDPEIRLISCMVTQKVSDKVDGHRGMIVLDMQLSTANQFALLREALPASRRIGMMYSSHAPASMGMYERARSAAPAGIEVIGIDIDAHSSKSQAIKALFQSHLDVVWTDADTAVYDGAVVRALLLGALKRNMPVFGFSPEFVRSGALLGVGVDPEAQGRIAANTIKKLFDHNQTFDEMDSADVVILEADSSDVAVNLLVADQIGVDIPRSLIARAKHIFK